MKHVKDFIRKNPGADGIFGIVDVEPGEWLVNLEHLEKNNGSDRHWDGSDKCIGHFCQARNERG
jgi:hypothetical protein